MPNLMLPAVFLLLICQTKIIKSKQLNKKTSSPSIDEKIVSICEILRLFDLSNTNPKISSKETNIKWSVSLKFRHFEYSIFLFNIIFWCIRSNANVNVNQMKGIKHIATLELVLESGVRK